VLDDDVDFLKVLEQGVEVGEMESTAGVVAAELALAVEYIIGIEYRRVRQGFNRAAPSLLAYSLKSNACIAHS
jgi:hypothetical protein